jgi:hypothetical protein
VPAAGDFRTGAADSDGERLDQCRGEFRRLGRTRRASSHP